MWRLKLVRRACSGKAGAGAAAVAGSSSKPSWNLYGRLLEKHPIKAKMLSSGLIMGGGDLACQYLTRRHAEQEAEAAAAKEKGPHDPHNAQAEGPEAGAVAGFDLRRTAKFAFMGFVFIGPMLHHWYSFLVRAFPGGGTAPAVKRLILDQSLFAPTFIPIFFTGLQFLDFNFNLGEIKAKLEADYADTLVANWKLWVPAMFINFRLVPSKYQVLFSNGVGFVWNIYLSYQSFKPRADDT